MISIGYRLGVPRLLGGTRPSLNLNFLSGTLDSRVTFSRVSNATLVDSTGRVTYAPNNLLLRSEQFDNAAWTKTNSTITANATTAPDGTLTADKHIPNNGVLIGVGAAETRVFQNATAIIGANYVYSMYAKAGEFDQIRFALIAGPTVTATFSLTSGTVVSGAGASITPVGDGWYRCSFTVTSGVDGALAVRWSANSSTVSVGDGTSGIFVWGSQFEAITYQTLPSTYVQTVASAYYGPRFDYNPFSLAPLGLLIEEQRANLVLRSEEIDNAIWAKDFITVTANAATAPSDTTTADKAIPTAGADLTSIGQGTVRTGATYTAGATLTFSVFAKEAEFDRIQLFFSEGTGTGNRAQVEYSLVDGSVVSAAAIVGTFTSPSSTATPVGNGWYRFTLTFTTGSGASGRARLAVRDSGTTTGDGTSGILIWGAQVEAGAFATSYIPTGSATATRTADIATMTGTNFSSWYNAPEGTFVSSFEASPNPYTTYIAASDGVVAQNSIHMDNDIGGTMRVPYYSGSAPSTILSLGAIGTIGAINTIATAYKVNDFAASRNGAAVVTDPAGALPVGVVQLNIGADPSGTAVNVSNRHIRFITFYPQRLTNAQLQVLSISDASLNLNFLSGTLDPRITFTRSTTGTFVGSNGLIQTAAINAPRFDYNPITLAPRGLLIEEQRVNLLLYSAEFDNAGWGKSFAAVTANVTTSPDGTTNADRLTANGSSNPHDVRQTVTFTAAAHTLSVYAKRDTNNFVQLRVGVAAIGTGFANFDLNAGTVGTIGAGLSAASITPAGNGWFRCTITGTTAVASTVIGFYVVTSATAVSAESNTLATSVFLYDAQLEVGSFATSVIPTTTAQVTRTADVAAMTGTNFSSWYNASEGTIVVSADSVRPAATSPATRVFQFDDGTVNNNIRSGSTATLQVVDAGVTQVNIAGVPVIAFDGAVFKFASAYKLNDFATVTSGAVATDTSGTVPTVTQLSLGGPTTSGVLNGHIRTFTYYPQRIDNTQLLSLTL